MQTRHRILRDIAGHLAASSWIATWTEVTTVELHGFLACRTASRHQDTYVLHRFFAGVRLRKLILIHPARPLRPGPQPGFTGTVLGPGTQLASLWVSTALKGFAQNRLWC